MEAKIPSSKNYKRKYPEAHDLTEKRKKDNAARKRARRKMEKLGKVSKGDGKHVDHKNGNPRDNRTSNLKATSPRKNTSYARTKTAGKKSKRS